MKESLSLQFLYKTAPGRMVLKLLVRPEVSVIGGLFMKSPLSKPLISYYINKYDISLKDIDVPSGGFKSFNDFFTRKKKAFRIKDIDGRMITPCDGFLTVLPVKEDTVLSVKHSQFTLKELLGDKKLADKFIDGTVLIYRLTPSHYHRYVFAADGVIKRIRKIRGVLHCVRPIVTEDMPVFVQNSREYQVIDTVSFGKMVQMEVGALMVGKISNNAKYKVKSVVHAGTEKGYFEFGGSTIIVLLQKDAVSFTDEIINMQKEGGEHAVTIGSIISK